MNLYTTISKNPFTLNGKGTLEHPHLNSKFEHNYPICLTDTDRVYALDPVAKTYTTCHKLKLSFEEIQKIRKNPHQHGI